MFQSLPLVDVYVAAIPRDIPLTPLYPDIRQAELDGVSNEGLKREKWCVWKLLEYALERSLGIKMKNVGFEKSSTGRWGTERCDFSLSHCDGAIAVAVSRKPVGVDIECVSLQRQERFADKILTDGERTLYEQLPEEKRAGFIIEKWTAKEALFKKSGDIPAFIPKDHDTLSGSVRTLTVRAADRDYTLSVATDTPDALRVYEDIDLLSKL